MNRNFIPRNEDLFRQNRSLDTVIPLFFFWHGFCYIMQRKERTIMELLYKQEHFACYNYADDEYPSIQIIESGKNSSRDINFNINTILFVLNGEIKISFGKIVDKKVKENEIILIPTNSDANIRFDKDSILFLFRLTTSLNFCDHFPLELLLEGNEKKASNHEAHVLKSNERISDFLQMLYNSMQDGLKCSYFFDIKLKEILFYLRGYYTKEELYDFFYPVLSTDIHFSEQVFQNQKKAKNVKELASLLNYSLSGFEKRFKKVFGIPASQWLKERKAEGIYHTINCSRKTFTEIAYDYGFSSAAHFSNFCKTAFGETPGNIRRKNLDELEKVKKKRKKKVRE